MNNKAQLFTLDLLLALVPLTLVLGMSANAISGVAAQIQEYAFFYSIQRQAGDAIDVLIKTPGVPPNWNATIAPTTVGLAKYNQSENRIYSHVLDGEKVAAMNGSYLQQLLRGYSYFNLSIASLNQTVPYFQSFGTGSKSGASSVVAVRRNALLNTTEVSVTLEAGK